MGNETQLSPDRLNWILELARQMPPGHERNEALRLAAASSCGRCAGIGVPKTGPATNVKPSHQSKTA